MNRFLSILPGAGEVVLDAVCFESCEECEEVVVPDTEVTFNVDMSEQTVSGAVYISGETIDGWAGASVELTDADGDNVYSVTLSLPQGDHEYKYMIGSWDTSEQLDETEDAACTITTGGFTNRLRRSPPRTPSTWPPCATSPVTPARASSTTWTRPTPSPSTSSRA